MVLFFLNIFKANSQCIPELKMIEVTSKLAKMWNELEDNDKEFWKSKEAEENAKVSAIFKHELSYCKLDISDLLKIVWLNICVL